MTVPVYILKIILLLILAAAAVMDMKTASLPLWFIAAAFIPGIILQFIIGETGILNILAGCATGGVILIIAFASHQAIGYADALILISTGIYLGFEGNIALILISLFISALASVIFMIFFKMKGKSSFPFMPFILSGYICLLALS